MAIPIRNITQATLGQITATPAATKRKLAISVQNVRGATGIRGRRRGRR